MYDEVVHDVISALWYSDKQAESVAKLAETLYYSAPARRSLDTLVEEMTEVLLLTYPLSQTLLGTSIFYH